MMIKKNIHNNNIINFNNNLWYYKFHTIMKED